LSLRLFKYSPKLLQTISPWTPKWLPSCSFEGEDQFPLLEPSRLSCAPTEMVSFARTSEARFPSSTAIHGYLDDYRLNVLLTNPKRWLLEFAKYLAVVTPDFSVKYGMPPHERTLSTWMSRAVGVYYQHHGLHVIPNVRWAQPSDLPRLLIGIPKNSTISMSTQSICDDVHLKRIFLDGLPSVIDFLKPETVLIYGNIPIEALRTLDTCPNVRQFMTDMHRVHKSRGI